MPEFLFITEGKEALLKRLRKAGFEETNIYIVRPLINYDLIRNLISDLHPKVIAVDGELRLVRLRNYCDTVFHSIDDQQIEAKVFSFDKSVTYQGVNLKTIPELKSLSIPAN